LKPVPLPPGVVTTMLNTPFEWAGVVAVMVVALTTVTPVAAAPPKVTLVAPVKLVPVMVTAVPPSVEPLLGATPVTVGACASAGALPTALAPSETIRTANPRRTAPTKPLAFRVGRRSFDIGTGGAAAKIADAANGLVCSCNAVLAAALLDDLLWLCSTAYKPLKSWSETAYSSRYWVTGRACRVFMPGGLKRAERSTKNAL
jgi:hypothetical protein